MASLPLCSGCPFQLFRRVYATTLVLGIHGCYAFRRLGTASKLRCWDHIGKPNQVEADHMVEVATMAGTGGQDQLYAVADFCLIPMGLPTPSVGPQIAECQRVLERSGLEYKLHGYGTNVEGPWDKVMEAIGECHRAVHAMNVPRIATDIRIGTRTDRNVQSGVNDGKVKRVEQILLEE